jgi:hypothetical protein
MTPSAKMNLVLLILLFSLGINVYQLTLLKKCTSECYDMKDSSNIECCDTSSANNIIDWSFCENKGRFDGEKSSKGGIETDEVSAKEDVMAYRKAHVNDQTVYTTTGFLFSKKVFDHIFNNPDQKINTVRFDLIVKDKKLSLIAKGISTDFTDITYNNNKTSRVFINQSMCPIDCQFNLW